MKTISKASTWAILLYEFLGSAFMVYAYNVSVLARPFVYFMFWVLAYKVSGAHFNPATSLAVFTTEKQVKNLSGFLFTMLVQILGAYLGCGISYLLIKDYTKSFYLLPNGNNLYFNSLGDVYWARIILQEVIQTFIFTLVYLVLKYDASMNKIDRVLKGVVISLVFIVCLSMTRGSGGCLNPALGMA